ncbi:trypsin-1-like [Mytilus californianus]|uniref:trypsin-1-like n=1 Tax=Mytilus californianus TaxID=6549 RepID=UPI002247F41F|nr:trypsin-1-like [Mytilus californianus]
MLSIVKMKYLVCCLIFGVVAASSNYGGPMSIVGGTNASPNQYPYQISMKSASSDHFCGGSLVRTGSGEIVVVTAAHCLSGESASDVQVVVGRHTIDGSTGNQYTKEYKVKKIILHPEYDDDTFNNDGAIMYLDGTVETNPGVQPIELTDKPTVNFFNQECIITGWGALIEGDSGPNILQHASVDFFPDVKCTKDYGSSYEKKTMLCGGKRSGGIDSCQGDSGGPFACKENGKLVLSGVTSWGQGCAQAGSPGIYTDVFMMRRFLDGRLGLISA